MRTRSWILALFVVVAVFAFGFACRAEAARPSAEADWKTAERALLGGDWRKAQTPLARLAQRDLGNAHLQFLYALTEDQLARNDGSARLRAAEVGYAATTRLDAGHYWALLKLGFVCLEQRDWLAAQKRFAEAILDQPDRWEAYYGLGVASYFRENYAMLKLACIHGLEIATDEPDLIRLNAYTMAVEGHPEAKREYARSLGRGDDARTLPQAEKRIDEFLLARSRAALSASLVAFGPSDSPAEGAAIDPIGPSQIVVEVTIILSSVLESESRGVNLFDGLRMLYGYDNTLNRLTDFSGTQSTRAITSRISTPELNYSLNLFNDSGQRYSVVARPSITAFAGRESRFFSGRVINVELSTVNVASLEPVEVGVGLSVTPETITPDKVTVTIEANRSYLSREEAGTFDKSLSTFRQSVAATAEVRFGQTLVLSALSEQVSDRSYSHVPFANRIPILGSFAKQKTDTIRKETLLILITPELPVNLDTKSSGLVRDLEVQRLERLWHERLEPGSDLQAILDRLEPIPWLRKPEPGDLSLRTRSESAITAEAIRESLIMARR